MLTMSATPIPRTLEMSLAGIREMSTIATPPEDRHPILTYVGAFDDKLVAAAIRRELLRDGQVFLVHNRVSDIEKVAARIREQVPEATVVTAHGQMGEHALERVIDGFWKREFDVLVCTTIVETGLDISNANTLIVDHAEMLGLSQMHQLRGRVGRGRERGYAYFLYPPDKALTETALDRLATIAQNSDLGSGMAVAMKDLEIRGAGSILGAEQSGHIAGVGFDLYVRLVSEAVTAFKKQAGAGRRTAPRTTGPRRSGSSCRWTPTCRTTTSRPRCCGWTSTARSPTPSRAPTSRPSGRTGGPVRPDPAARRGPARRGRPAPSGPAGRDHRDRHRRSGHQVLAGGPAGVRPSCG